MSFHRKSLVSILALPALAAGILIPSAVYGTATHQAAHRAVLTAVQAPAQLDASFMTATRLGAVRAAEAREERAEARAEAWRQHEAVLLAARQRVLAVQAARAHVAAVAAVHVRAVHVRAVAPAVSGAQVFSYAGIEALWRQAGGAAWAQSTAACIGTAESGGRSWATHVDDSGQVDYGVMQMGNDPSALNPLVGMVAAVAMSHDGANWSPWTTASSCGV
jgi:hypothetical protein